VDTFSKKKDKNKNFLKFLPLSFAFFSVCRFFFGKFFFDNFWCGGLGVFGFCSSVPVWFVVCPFFFINNKD